MDSTEFKKEVKALFDATAQIKEIAAAAKAARDPIKQSLAETEERVKEYMKLRGIEEIEYSGHLLHCKEVTRGLSLSRKTLLAALESYYGDPDQAEEVFEALMDIIGHKEVTVLSKRVMKNAPAKTTEPAAAVPDNPVDRLDSVQINDVPPELGYDSD